MKNVSTSNEIKLELDMAFKSAYWLFVEKIGQKLVRFLFPRPSYLARKFQNICNPHRYSCFLIMINPKSMGKSRKNGLLICVVHAFLACGSNDHPRSCMIHEIGKGVAKNPESRKGLGPNQNINSVDEC